MSKNQFFCKLSPKTMSNELVSLEIFIPRLLLAQLQKFASDDGISLNELSVDILDNFADGFQSYLDSEAEASLIDD